MNLELQDRLGSSVEAVDIASKAVLRVCDLDPFQFQCLQIWEKVRPDSPADLFEPSIPNVLSPDHLLTGIYGGCLRNETKPGRNNVYGNIDVHFVEKLLSEEPPHSYSGSLVLRTMYIRPTTVTMEDTKLGGPNVRHRQIESYDLKEGKFSLVGVSNDLVFPPDIGQHIALHPIEEFSVETQQAKVDVMVRVLQATSALFEKFIFDDDEVTYRITRDF